jgi:KaiC/GvpD/RAD55 family RecA-like ATPase
MTSVKILNGDEKKLSLGAIPNLLQEALGVTFDHRLGHDYFHDARERYLFYTQDEVRIKCSIDIINKITCGGFPRKTLCLFISPSGGGKSAVMCSLAADFIRDGMNVLYITLELAEERVAERIDANLFNIPIQDVKNLPEKIFLDKVSAINEKVKGKLFIKEYPTGVGSAGQFKALINDMIAKKGFKPDVLIVDYLGICA